MKVGIDARMLGSGKGGGETYVRNMIQGLSTVNPDDDYTLFLNEFLPKDTLPGVERMRQVVVSRHNHVPNPLSFSLALARARVDVAHAQYMAPWPWPVRLVVSLHDIAYERYPQFFDPGTVAGFRIYVPLTLRRARIVLTLSEFCKEEIVRRYRVPPEKVMVTYCAANSIFRPLLDATRLGEVRVRYGTGDRFILCVGNLEPRKNLRAMIEAYVKLRQADATRHKLVLVGRKGWLFDEIFAAARASGYADDLVFTDYVPDADLVALYNAADLFVYPSIYEGFGIPPLEAMACGTPVVCSNTSSLPEVVGDAALMVDPLDVEALAESVARVLDDEALRARLAARGPERAAFYTWEKTGQILADVYRTAAGLPQ